MNIHHGLLFQHGYITDPKLAVLLAGTANPQEPLKSPVRSPRRRGLLWLIEELVLLGGRPVSRPHYDDLDEPFPPLHRCA